MVDLKLLLLQLLVILVAARAVGWVIRGLGQPRVIGEIIAGLALGPSIFGALTPGVAAQVFPQNGMGALSVLSQLGVLLFLFTVGLRFDPGHLRGRAAAAAVAVSHASIVVPFALGLAIAPAFHPALAGQGTALLPFALFLGAAMSVTAFPVLARILTERGLDGTRVGAIAIACAAVDDATAWCLLAAVVAVAKAGATLWVVGRTLLLTAGFAVCMLVLGRRLASGWLARRPTTSVDAGLVSLAVLTALGSALVTEAIGVHALFGAFLAGIVVPRERAIATQIASRLEDVVGHVLLPIFFAFTGLRTDIRLLNEGGLWVSCALVLTAAVTGKLGGSAVAARVAGMRWRDATVLGLLMNTRGLMELVILGVGLELGVISRTLFAMLVLMALLTTVMTSPLLSLVFRLAPNEERTAMPAVR